MYKFVLEGAEHSFDAPKGKLYETFSRFYPNYKLEDRNMMCPCINPCKCTTGVYVCTNVFTPDPTNPNKGKKTQISTELWRVVYTRDGYQLSTVYDIKG